MNNKAHFGWCMVALGVLLSVQVARAKPLSDGISSSIGFEVQPGSMELIGQQNLTPRFGLRVGYHRESILDEDYAGWRLGTNYLLYRWFGENWIANSVLSGGFGGTQGAEHGHSMLWARADHDWENRHFLVATSLGSQWGTRMLPINDGQIRLGFSPWVANMKSIQPWLILAGYSRSGFGGRALVVARLVSWRWLLELGTSITTSDRVLNLTVVL